MEESTITSQQTQELLDFENKLAELSSVQIGKPIPRWLVKSAEVREFAQQAHKYFTAWKKAESISTTFN